jgi:hypothetical protein
MKGLFIMISYDEFVDYLRDNGMSDTECALAMYLIEQDYGDYLSALEAFGYEEADRETYEDALRDLYNSYEVTRNFGDYYECGSLAYYVFDDYDDAYDEAVRYEKDTIEEIGPEGINGYEDFVETSWFEDAMRESYEAYCNDIENESSSNFGNRLIEECYDAGLIDDDDFELDEDGDPDYDECTVASYDLVDRLTEHLCDGWNDPVQWYIDNFGHDSFREVIDYHGLVDTDRLAEYCVDADGIGHSLASYDGNDIEYEFDGFTYYMYRAR